MVTLEDVNDQFAFGSGVVEEHHVLPVGILRARGVIERTDLQDPASVGELPDAERIVVDADRTFSFKRVELDVQIPPVIVRRILSQKSVDELLELRPASHGLPSSEIKPVAQSPAEADDEYNARGPWLALDRVSRR